MRAASPVYQRTIFASLVSTLGWYGVLGSLFSSGLGLSAFLAPDFWLADNMSFFLRLLLLGGLAGALAGIIGLSIRHRLSFIYKMMVAAACAGLVALAALTGMTVLANTTPIVPIAANEKPLKIISLNLERLFLSTEDLRQFIAREDPDIVLLQEVGWGWQKRKWKRLGQPLGGPEPSPFPEHFAVGRRGSLMVYSKHPIKAETATTVEGEYVPSELGDHNPNREIVAFSIDWRGTPIRFLSIHPESPRSKLRWQNKNLYFNALDSELGVLRDAGQEHVIVAGDWNTSPWSGRFQRLLNTHDLVTAYPGGWPQTTRFFYDFRLRALLGATVDHFAVTRNIAVHGVSLGPNVGSDHLPLIIEIDISG